MRKATCSRFFPSRWKIGQPCFSKSFSARAAADSAKATSKLCLNRSRWSRRSEEICSDGDGRDYQTKSCERPRREDAEDAEYGGRALPVRVWQRVRERSGCRHIAARPKCSAARCPRSLYGAAKRNSVYGAARGQSAHVAL